MAVRKPCLVCSAVFLALTVIVCQSPVSNDPAPFTVHAGEDTTIRANYSINLIGTVQGENTTSLTRLWTQVSPQSPQADIRFADSDTCNVLFGNDTGTYVFEFSVTNGQRTARDQVRIVVGANLPFKVLAPAGGERVEIGTVFPIRWQLDPPFRCRVAYQIGDKEVSLGVGKLSDGVEGYYEWDLDPEIDTNLTPGTEVVIKVTRYGSSYDTFSDPFVLVAPGSR